MSCKKILSFLVVFLSAVSISGAAFATRYECTPQQSYAWKDGKIQEEESAHDSSLILNDSTGALWVNGRPVGLKLHIAQKLHTDNALVASKETSSGDYTSSIVFRIRHFNKDQANNLEFLFLSDDGIEAGHCTIMK